MQRCDEIPSEFLRPKGAACIWRKISKAYWISFIPFGSVLHQMEIPNVCSVAPTPIDIKFVLDLSDMLSMHQLIFDCLKDNHKPPMMLPVSKSMKDKANMAVTTKLAPDELHKVKARAAALETVAMVTTMIMIVFVGFCHVGKGSPAPDATHCCKTALFLFRKSVMKLVSRMVQLQNFAKMTAKITTSITSKIVKEPSKFSRAMNERIAATSNKAPATEVMTVAEIDLASRSDFSICFNAVEVLDFDGVGVVAVAAAGLAVLSDIVCNLCTNYFQLQSIPLPFQTRPSVKKGTTIGEQNLKDDIEIFQIMMINSCYGSAGWIRAPSASYRC